MARGLRIEGVAKRINRAVGTTYQLSIMPGFPPPREVIGRVKLWAAEDIDFWKRTRVDRRTLKRGRLARRK